MNLAAGEGTLCLQSYLKCYTLGNSFSFHPKVAKYLRALGWTWIFQKTIQNMLCSFHARFLVGHLDLDVYPYGFSWWCNLWWLPLASSKRLPLWVMSLLQLVHIQTSAVLVVCSWGFCASTRWDRISVCWCLLRERRNCERVQGERLSNCASWYRAVWAGRPLAHMMVLYLFVHR